jgi:hypothetical protein
MFVKMRGNPVLQRGDGTRKRCADSEAVKTVEAASAPSPLPPSTSPSAPSPLTAAVVGDDDGGGSRPRRTTAQQQRAARYEAYKGAQTVGEALALGASIRDVWKDLVAERAVIVTDYASPTGYPVSGGAVRGGGAAGAPSRGGQHRFGASGDDAVLEDGGAGLPKRGEGKARGETGELSALDLRHIQEGCARFEALDATKWFLESKVATQANWHRSS